ncbi:MAG: ribosome-associated translation inhibitor RaiA [Actinobacteria bacterium]|nr:ribosome-associated translation inhibitor RaiA [Actinomycetota bacterium]
MEVIIKGRHIEVTDALRRYAEDKVSRLTKYLEKITKVEIELIVDKNPSVPNPQTAEVTLHTKGPLIRGKASTDNMYASIDGVVDKIQRQIKKYKGKLYGSHKQASGLAELALQHSGETISETGEIGPKVVKTKRVSLKPMTTEEAALQMELLGHDFFVFTNSETDELNVVYRRRDKNYGLIEPIFGKG